MGTKFDLQYNSKFTIIFRLAGQYIEKESLHREVITVYGDRSRTVITAE